MSDTREVLVARIKFARAVGHRPDELAMLDDLAAADLETLRHQVGDALYEAERPRFVRIASLAKAVPGAVAAKIAEAAVPPDLAARAANAIEPDRAIGMVGRLSDEFLARVACVLDVDRVSQLISLIDADKIAAVAASLARAGEWVVIGQFVDHVSEDAVRASVRRLDGEQLLRSGYYIDDARRLEFIGGILTDEQIDHMIVAAAEHELYDHAAWIAGNLGADGLARLSSRYAEADADVRERFEAAATPGTPASDALALLVTS